MTEKIISFESSESGVRYSTSGFPMSKWQCRLISVRRSYRHSLLRILVEEFRNFPLRIASILRNPTLRLGATIPPYPHHAMEGENCQPIHSYLHACSEHMRELQKEHRWIGILEAQMGAQLFARGFASAHHISCSEKRTACTEGLSCSHSRNLKDGVSGYAVSCTNANR
jgi:hypothetical protein